MTYAQAARVSGRSRAWETAQRIVDGLGIGDIDATPGDEPALELDAPGDSPDEIFALLELYRAAERPAYLERARGRQNDLGALPPQLLPDE